MNNYAIIWNGKPFEKNFSLVCVKYGKKRSLGHVNGVRCAYLENTEILYKNKEDDFLKLIKNDEKSFASDPTLFFEDEVKISRLEGSNITCSYLFSVENDNLALMELQRIKNKLTLHYPFYDGSSLRK